MNANMIGFYTILHKEIRRFLRIWIQTILPPAITVVLYFAIFGQLIGEQIAPISGFTFMQFIAPGLIMMSIITNAYANVVSSLYGTRFQKSIEEILVSPIPNYLILLGFTAGGVARGLLVGALVTVIALFFAHLQIHNLFIIIATSLLAAILFSLAGFLNGLFARNFDDITIIPTFVLTPLTYFGGVFYSIESLSPFWQKLSIANPILHIVNIFRYSLIGISDVDITIAFSILAFAVIFLFFFNLYLLNKGVGIRT